MFGPFFLFELTHFGGQRRGQCWISEFYSNFIVCDSGNKILNILFQILESFLCDIIIFIEFITCIYISGNNIHGSKDYRL